MHRVTERKTEREEEREGEPMATEKTNVQTNGFN